MGKRNPVAAIAAPVKKITEEVKKKPAEAASKFLGGVPAVIASEGFKATTGKKADAFFNPIGTAAGNVGEKYVDEPKIQAKQFKADMAKAAADQANAMAEFERNQAQSSAEKAAGEKLLGDIAAQKRRRAKSGREATILSQKLGESSTTGRKSLLGL